MVNSMRCRQLLMRNLVKRTVPIFDCLDFVLIKQVDAPDKKGKGQYDQQVTDCRFVFLRKKSSCHGKTCCDPVNIPLWSRRMQIFGVTKALPGCDKNVTGRFSLLQRRLSMKYSITRLPGGKGFWMEFVELNRSLPKSFPASLQFLLLLPDSISF